MDRMIWALALFIVMYVLLLVFSQRRWIIALCAAFVFVVSGLMPLGGVLKAVNWNVLMMLTGTMVLVELFIQSRRSMAYSQAINLFNSSVRGFSAPRSFWISWRMEA